jgi:hypothetical protein
MPAEYYWKECFGICLEGAAEKHWLIRNDDDCEDIIAEVSRPRDGYHNAGLWRGEAFRNYTKECETLEEAQKLTLKLVQKVAKSMSKIQIRS